MVIQFVHKLVLCNYLLHLIYTMEQKGCELSPYHGKQFQSSNCLMYLKQKVATCAVLWLPFQILLTSLCIDIPKIIIQSALFSSLALAMIFDMLTCTLCPSTQ